MGSAGVQGSVTFHIDVKQDAADEVVEDTTEDVAKTDNRKM